MFALIDCNNFFVACERVFRPDLRGRPLVVLSSNDACVISRSQEAKDLGIAMGQAWSSCRDWAEQQGVLAFSCNAGLYMDMSQRVMQIVRAQSAPIEVYSIDECFVDLQGVQERVAWGQRLRATIGRWTGIPVCIGIASSKTRAKLANHLAKKYAVGDGVCDLEALEAPQRRDYARQVAVAEVWGVGARWQASLAAQGVHSVADLVAAAPRVLRELGGLSLLRTQKELQGQPCLRLQDEPQPRQQIMVSRSLAQPLSLRRQVQQVLLRHVAHAASTLRRQGQLASSLRVLAQVAVAERRERPQPISIKVPLVMATQDDRQLFAAAQSGLEQIDQPSWVYHKLGVMLCELSPAQGQQQDLFPAQDLERSQRLLQAVDRIRGRFGRDRIVFAAQGLSLPAGPRCEMRSPAYTRDWLQLPEVRA